MRYSQQIDTQMRQTHGTAGRVVPALNPAGSYSSFLALAMTEAITPIRGPGRPAAYTLADGTKVPSVTTVLGRFKDSGGLINWAFKRGKEGAPSLYADRDAAAEVGTIVHGWVQADICGGEREACPPELELRVQSAYTAWREWWDQSRLVVVATELPLVSEEHRFAGTLDAVGMHPERGEMVLIDWKTANGVYSDNLLQLAGYKGLWDEEHPDQLIRGFHLCRFSKEHGDFEHRYWPELSEAWAMFLHLLRAYDLDRSVRKRV